MNFVAGLIILKLKISNKVVWTETHLDANKTLKMFHAKMQCMIISLPMLLESVEAQGKREGEETGITIS